MQHTIARISRPMQWCLDGFIAFLLAVLVCDVLLGVVSRYVFGAQVEWTEELACYLLIWIGIVGAAAAFAKKKHLGLDALVTMFPESSRRRAAIISDAVCLFFTAFVFLYGGIMLTIQEFNIGSISPALQLPKGFVFLALPISGTFMAVFQIESLLQSLSGTSPHMDRFETIPASSQEGSPEGQGGVSHNLAQQGGPQ
ncbi:MAG: TRAP transporter small permease [Planctomycetaceae bacterium]|nr:TRAP transporter small permease [Planctomycetaceae bacterium]